MIRFVSLHEEISFGVHTNRNREYCYCRIRADLRGNVKKKKYLGQVVKKTKQNEKNKNNNNKQTKQNKQSKTNKQTYK